MGTLIVPADTARSRLALTVKARPGPADGETWSRCNGGNGGDNGNDGNI